MKEIKIAIIGVGNCSSSLLQGIEYYKNKKNEKIPGIMHTNLGGYYLSDVKVVAAFDVDKNKVGKDIAEAIFTLPNNTIKFSDVPLTGIKVQRGKTLDGLGKYYKQVVEESSLPEVDIAETLKASGAEIVINYLPVGSEEATLFYANEVLKAGCGFINCIPVFIAKKPEWRKKFEDKKLPLIGDDIKSQVGATISHRILSALYEARGVELERTYQLNVGGNMDFKNMLERDRLESKKISKTNAVTSILSSEISSDNVHIGPSDYVAWLTDRKWAYIRLEGKSFGDVPLNIELKLEVWDSPNSAGVVIDAIRCCKLALDRGIGGSLEGPSAYFMKSPMVQHLDEKARDLVEKFIVEK